MPDETVALMPPAAVRPSSIAACKACAAYAANPLCGVTYAAGCRACTVRSLARSPGFHASMAAGKFRADYRAALQAAAGGGWAELHLEVKAWSEHQVGA